MKPLHNISDTFSGLYRQGPKGNGYACIMLLDNEFVDKRCLYIKVS